MQFQPGQHVISNGTMYIYKHDATAQGKPPSNVKNRGGDSIPRPCAHAIVTIPGSTTPILMHRSALRPVSDTVEPRKIEVTPPVKRSAPTGLDIIKADALDAQAERLEGYAKSLRSEARTLRGEI